jgi:hypothetical protein
MQAAIDEVESPEEAQSLLKLANQYDCDLRVKLWEEAAGGSQRVKGKVARQILDIVKETDVLDKGQSRRQDLQIKDMLQRERLAAKGQIGYMEQYRDRMMNRPK